MTEVKKPYDCDTCNALYAKKEALQKNELDLLRKNSDLQLTISAQKEVIAELKGTVKGLRERLG